MISTSSATPSEGAWPSLPDTALPYLPGNAARGPFPSPHKGARDLTLRARGIPVYEQLWGCVGMQVPGSG